MNEHELSTLLHKAAGEASVSTQASPRILRRARFRLAVNTAVMLSSILLVAGGGLALATRSTEGLPAPMPAGPVVTPGPQEEFITFRGEDEVILAEEEGADSTWAFTVEERGPDLCLNSMTYKVIETKRGVFNQFEFGPVSGIADCEPLGVPDSRELGYYMWDSGKNQRLEVLGAVSTDVARLELQESHSSDNVITIIKAPNELGDERNFFYLWLTMGEVGNLVAYDNAGNVLQESELCFEPGAQDVSCTVGEQSSTSGSKVASPPTGDLTRMACDEISPGQVGRLEGQATPEKAIHRWIDNLDLRINAGEFEIERIGSKTVTTILPAAKGKASVSATLTKNGDDQWSIVELYYCEGIVDPDRNRLPKGLPPPPSELPKDQPPPPSSPSP